MYDVFDLTEKLSRLCGTSGDEDDVRARIKELLPDGCEAVTDNIGNLIVTKKGDASPKNKVMLCAHMDEVGFIITDIASDGRLKFAPIGWISPAVVYGRSVVFKNGITGVIAGKAVHQLGDDKDKQPKIEDLSIDIGAINAEEAAQHIKKGDCCYFTGTYEEFGDGFIKGKALDDRAGCAIMLCMLDKPQKYDITCVFTVQEEIGTRGALCAAYNVKPDMAIVLETTTACDIAGVEGEKAVCRLGEGAVISYMDKGTIYDRELYKLAFATADELGVKCQTKTVVAGGNDSGALHKAVGGIRTAAVSVPTRYLHSPACVMKKEDAEAVMKTAEALFIKMCEL